jgi:hypothetical protein
MKLMKYDNLVVLLSNPKVFRDHIHLLSYPASRKIAPDRDGQELFQPKLLLRSALFRLADELILEILPLFASKLDLTTEIITDEDSGWFRKIDRWTAPSDAAQSDSTLFWSNNFTHRILIVKDLAALLYNSNYQPQNLL